MTQRQANDLLMEQWFRLHKTPPERWAEECKRLAPFDTLDEYLSAVSVEHFGEDVLKNFRPHRFVKAKIEKGNVMDTEKINRLTDALLTFVERASKKAASETEVEVLPQVASVLVEIIKLNV